jgi:hypothetical protein
MTLIPSRQTTRATLTALFLSAMPARADADELELALRLGAFGLTENDPNLGSVGVSGGPTVLWRLGDHFALGGMLDTAWIHWSAPGSSDGVILPGLGFPDPDGSVQSTLTALSARWYVLGSGTFQPHLQLSAGYVAVIETPDHPDCGDGSGASGELAMGLDWSLSSLARIGGSAGARPFRMGRGCNSIGYRGSPPDPPHGGLALSGQLAFTTVWAAR